MLKRCAVLLFFALLSGSASAQTERVPLKLLSPDGQLEVTVALDSEGAPIYSVAYRNQPVIAPSTLGLEFKSGGLLSKHLRLMETRRDARDETYPLVTGKARQARDHYNELVASLEESQAPHRKLELVFRAYDDGAAFRYRLPAQAGLSNIEIAAERSQFRFPTDLTCWALQRDSFSTSYEGEYDRMTLNRIGPNAIIGLPLVVEMRDEATTVALAEADLDNYAGLYFTGLNNGYGVQSRLAPRKDDASVSVRGRVREDGFRTPWRVVMVAREPGRLIESTLIMNLNPPNAIGDASWVRPGKAAWDWWSGPQAAGVHQVGMNNETMKYYIDFASEFGLEYMLIDAGWYTPIAWGPNADLKADITKTVPSINLPELVEYARARKVGVWVWLNWVPTNDQMDTAFPYYEKLGIKGVKVDFMDRDDQEMVAFYHRILKTAAAHHLMVDLHGAYKPTGLVRTYPNYVTQEGVMGAEYNKWSARVTATHNLTLPFTRMLLGPMDYTPGGFRNATRQQFEIHNTGPQVMTTRGQQLAMYVVYESPFACVSDSPDAYRNQPGSEFLKIVPTSWDETRVLAGQIGEFVAIARRRGREWFVGAMTNEQARDIQVPLDFLGGDSYQLSGFVDGAKPTDVRRLAEVIIGGKLLTTGKRNGANHLNLKLAAGGGCVLRFVPREH
ncbi:MAG TPA: glycoside hydrolase family 97 protein [Blastocatellia bacterium]|nr:glycoside hydrolase family 97 protein [Blastocatellia bacterium]